MAEPTHELIQRLTERIREMHGHRAHASVDQWSYFRRLGQQVFEVPETRMVARAMIARTEARPAVVNERLDDLTRRIEALEHAR